MYRKKRGFKKNMGEEDGEGNSHGQCQWITTLFPSSQELYPRSEYREKKGPQTNQSEFESQVKV